jgi:hypothetical protein
MTPATMASTVMTVASTVVAAMAVVVSVSAAAKMEPESGAVGVRSAVVAVVVVIIVSPHPATVAMPSMPVATAHPRHRINIAILRGGVPRVGQAANGCSLSGRADEAKCHCARRANKPSFVRHERYSIELGLMPVWRPQLILHWRVGMKTLAAGASFLPRARLVEQISGLHLRGKVLQRAARLRLHRAVRGLSQGLRAIAEAQAVPSRNHREITSVRLPGAVRRTFLPHLADQAFSGSAPFDVDYVAARLPN